MSSKNTSHGGVPSLAELLEQIDKIEREVSDLNRAKQRGEEFVKHMEAMIERDIKETAKVEQNIVSINKEIRDWEERERFLQNAIESGTQNSKLLLQMETNAKARLDHEKNTTNDLFHKLGSQISNYKKKIYDEESKLRQIPEYSKLITVEERIAAKNEEFLNGKKKIKILKNKIEELKVGKKSDEVSWSSFTKSCVNLAENWIKTRELSRELISLHAKKVKIDEQVKELKAKMTDLPVHEADVMEERREDDVNGRQTVKVSENVPAESSPSPCKVTPSPKKSYQPKFVLAPPPLTPTKKAAEVAAKSPTKETPEIPLEPPTPKTKSLHLKLGTSLLNLKKSKQAAAAEASPVKQSPMDLARKETVSLVEGSQVEAMEVEIAAEAPADPVIVEAPKDVIATKPSRGQSRPNSPMRNIINSVFSGSGDQNRAVKLKSFKFGLPTLFPKSSSSKPKANDVYQDREVVSDLEPSVKPILAPTIPLKLQAPTVSTPSKTLKLPEMSTASSKSPAKKPSSIYSGSKPSLLTNPRSSPRKEVASSESLLQGFEKSSEPDFTSSTALDFVPSPSKDDSMEVTNDLFGSTSNSNGESFKGSFFESSHNESGVFSGFGSGAKEDNDFFGGAKADEGWKLNESPGGFFFGDNAGGKEDEQGFSFNFGGSNEEEDFNPGGAFNFGGESETTDKSGGSFSFF